MTLKKAISVLSGGLDSAVATAKFNKKYQIKAITFDYGQKAAKTEIATSRRICSHLNIEHTVMNLKWLGELGQSSLTTEKHIPTLTEQGLDDLELCAKTADNVWVPGRNIVFTAIATAFAEAEDAEIIIVGWDEEEANTFPDNSKEFLESFNQTIKNGTKRNIHIEAPLIDMNKKEIIQLGTQLKLPLELTYSCYKGLLEHCGKCESCIRRKRAFKEAQIQDKTSYIE